MTFEQWLNEQGYQPSTVRSTQRMVRKAAEEWGAERDLGPYTKELRRFAAYLQSRPAKFGFAEVVLGASGDFAQYVGANYEPADPKPSGPQVSTPLDQEAWDALMDELSPKTPINNVLRILIGIPYPAQELRITMEETLDDLKRQLPPPYLPTLKRIKATGAPTLQVYLSGDDSYEAAYKKVQRRLREIGKALGRSLNMSDIGATGWELRFAAALEAP